eukprot:TRINITY_DN11554_c0_g1_i1.p1 TRINITY_DN11554_c0_g1~~TRINITY_DN11554_c0_g1_i1.p1  ORF type:complete len:488 (-),score=61.88 TRINITY_DN11554_c0_g1_i1:388-1773(-)
MERTLLARLALVLNSRDIFRQRLSRFCLRDTAPGTSLAIHQSVEVERVFRARRRWRTSVGTSRQSSHNVDVSPWASVEKFSQEEFEAYLLKMQERICHEAAHADGSGAEFGYDKWQRGEDPSAGYGITRVLEDGDLLEKAAANVSIVRGNLSPARAQAMSGRGRGVDAGAPYFAGALSLVFHPRNPYVPTFRADIRYFEVAGRAGWFGGGADLTPCYLFPDDAIQFHEFYRDICRAYDPSLYMKCKDLCDEYFFIKARKEHRGVGGIFFDDMEGLPEEAVTLPSADSKGGAILGKEVSRQGAREKREGSYAQDRRREDDDGRAESTDTGSAAATEGISGSQNAAAAYSFVRQVCEGFMPSFLPIAERRRTIAYGERERQWQLMRRGRYLEFNLLYDRGVRFGLDGGRVESIMVSAPPLIAWKYNRIPSPGSEEAALLEVLKTPRDWVEAVLVPDNAVNEAR